jgi:hypothetical protein
MSPKDLPRLVSRREHFTEPARLSPAWTLTKGRKTAARVRYYLGDLVRSRGRFGQVMLAAARHADRPSKGIETKMTPGAERVSYFFAVLIGANAVWDFWAVIRGLHPSYGPPYWLLGPFWAFAAFDLWRRARRAALQRRIDEIKRQP